MAYIDGFLALLGLQEGDRFNLASTTRGEKKYPNPFTVSEGKITNNLGNMVSREVLGEIIRQEVVIKKRPWRPQYLDRYWYIDGGGGVYYQDFNYNHPHDLMRYAYGNCFPSEKAALAGKAGILEKFKETRMELEGA